MTTPTPVQFWVETDEDASRICAVLEALGYSPTRKLDKCNDTTHVQWVADRCARRYDLSDRQRDVLLCVLEGMSPADIAQHLQISRDTVKWNMHDIFTKTNTNIREALLRLGLQLGDTPWNTK